MTGPLQLAWRYIRFHKMKTLILIACIFLTVFLPLAIRILLIQFEEKIVARANSTPTVIGAPGSDLELTLKTLYFQNRQQSVKTKKIATIPYGISLQIRERRWGDGVPVYARFTATGSTDGSEVANPIVGTTLDYFEFRQLEIENGNQLTMLGDCVLGAEIAERLQLKPGDRLASDRENVLDIGGLYPLNMLVRGILKRSNTRDDQAVFVDLKTAWVIEGLGHGHQNAESIDEDKLIGRDGNQIVTSAAVLPYTEITEANLGSFHFHGDLADFPIHAVIAIAEDTKSETLMLGHFQTDEPDAQIAIPRDVVRQLMDMVFKFEKFFLANAILIAASTVLLLGLVVMLSLRLRQREIETMFKLGCSKSTIATMLVGELAFVFIIAGLLVTAAVWGVSQIAGELVQNMLLG